MSKEGLSIRRASVTALALTGSLLLGACVDSSNPEPAIPIEEPTTFQPVVDGRPSVLTFGDQETYNDVVAECDGTTRVISGKYTHGTNIQLIGRYAGCEGVTPPGAQVLLTFADPETYNDVVAECDGTTRVYHHRYQNADLIAVDPNSPNCQPA